MLTKGVEINKYLGIFGCFFLLCLQIVHGLKVNMLEKCQSDYSDKAIALSGSDVAYVNIEGSNWWKGDSCVLIFKAGDQFDDLKLKFTSYKMHDCDVKFQVYTAFTPFFGSTDSTYSCTNAPLLNWKSTKNRYVKLKLKRAHSSTRDFSISLQLSVADYDTSSDVSQKGEGLDFAVVVGLVVFFIVLAIVVAVIIACCCCCSKSRRSSGTIFRQNYQAAPVATSNNNTGNVPQNWGPPPQGVQPSAPYPTLPGHGQAAPGSYPYGYGYPQGGAVPPAYPQPPPGYAAQQPPSYPGPVQPSVEPSAPPAMMEPPPPYPGQESTPLKGF